MKVVDPGHTYHLQEVRADHGHPCTTYQTLSFVKRFRGEKDHDGVINQEVIRALIDRVKFLDAEVPWEGNQQILHHLRMALALHEGRALIRKAEKGEHKPEYVVLGKDGHYALEDGED